MGQFGQKTPLSDLGLTDRMGCVVIWLPGRVLVCWHGSRAVFFIFFIFIFSFFTKIYFRFRNLQEYTPAAQLPSGRHLVAPLPGGRGLSVKIFVKKIMFRSLKDRSPGSGAAGPSGRTAAGRPVQVSWFFNIFRGRKELVFHLTAGLIVTVSLLSLHRANQHLLSFFHTKHSRAIN